jgi:hypothetical protein
MVVIGNGRNPERRNHPALALLAVLRLASSFSTERGIPKIKSR